MQRITKNPVTHENSNEDTFSDQDFSVFRTQLPRPTSTATHLLLASITFILALIAAIFYAER